MKPARPVVWAGCIDTGKPLCRITAASRLERGFRETDGMEKRVLIIGGGFAGLATGSYLVRSGVETLILEQHSQPGGLCTAWNRKGYTMDYCVHWLMGTDGESEFRRMWEELGAFESPDGSRTGIVNAGFFTRIGFPDGDSVCLYSDIDRLEEEFNRIAPEDRAVTRGFCRDLRSLSRMDVIVLAEQHGRLGRLLHTLKHAGSSIVMMRHATTTISSIAGRCRNPRLAETFLAGIPGDWSLIALSMGLAMQHTRRAGYPVGGSMALSRNIEAMYKRLGGRVRYNAGVESILVEGSRVVGVRLTDGEELRADYVVSAADGHRTLYGMLPGIGLPASLTAAYAEYPLFPSSIFVGLGINADLSHLPHASMLYIDEPLALPDGDTHHRLNVSVYNYDPTLAPVGRTFVAVLINTWKGPYWIDLRRKNPQEYAREKARIGAFVVDAHEEPPPYTPGASALSNGRAMDLSRGRSPHGGPGRQKRSAGNLQGARGSLPGPSVARTSPQGPASQARGLPKRFRSPTMLVRFVDACCRDAGRFVVSPESR